MRKRVITPTATLVAGAMALAGCAASGTSETVNASSTMTSTTSEHEARASRVSVDQPAAADRKAVTERAPESGRAPDGGTRAGTRAGAEPSSRVAAAAGTIDGTASPSPIELTTEPLEPDSAEGADLIRRPSTTPSTTPSPAITPPETTESIGSASPDPGLVGAGPGVDGQQGDWTTVLERQSEPSVAEVLAEAPKRGPIDLVTVTEQDGKPVITTTLAEDLEQAREVVEQAVSDPTVLSISPATEVRIQAEDPYRSAQWALSRIGVPNSWASGSTPTGSSPTGSSQPESPTAAGVTVAVLDTGVDAAHPDLNGVVLPGRDLVSGGDGRSDPHGHGTHVAGLIAAVAGNGIGVAGLAQGSRILPVRVLNSNGTGTDAAVAAGMVWAVDQGARVINMSVGAPRYSPAEAAAVAYALERGVVVVSASGNLRAQGDPTMYPAAFPGVIGVGAADTADRPAAFSSTGASVDLIAPGLNIISTYPPKTYAYMDGTSMSAPLVSATAALVRAAAPRATVGQIESILTSTARDIAPAGRDDASGHGMVQPVAAIELARRLDDGTQRVPDRNAQTISRLSVVSPPPRARYLSLARITYQLTVGGQPAVRTPITVCWTTAPSTTSRCLTQRSDAAGRTTLALRATGTLTVSAHFTGSGGVAASAARPLVVPVLPQITAATGRGTMTLQLSPTTPQAEVRVQHKIGAFWRTVATRNPTTSGRVSLDRLAAGTYRIVVSDTDRSMAAVSSTVRVG